MIKVSMTFPNIMTNLVFINIYHFDEVYFHLELNRIILGISYGARLENCHKCEHKRKKQRKKKLQKKQKTNLHYSFCEF